MMKRILYRKTGGGDQHTVHSFTRHDMRFLNGFIHLSLLNDLHGGFSYIDWVGSPYQSDVLDVCVCVWHLYFLDLKIVFLWFLSNLMEFYLVLF